MYKTDLFSSRRFLSGYRNGRSIKREREGDLFRVTAHPYGNCGQDFIWGGQVKSCGAVTFFVLGENLLLPFLQ